MERLRKAMFAQLIVVPLFHRHRILTQVAADNVNIVKLLPPLIAGQEEVDYFVAALDDVLADAHNGSSLIFEFGRTMAKGALRRGYRTPESVVPDEADPSSEGAIARAISPATGSSSPARPASSAPRSRARCSRGGAHVVAVIEPGGDERNLDGLGDADVERRTVDLRDARRACARPAPTRASSSISRPIYAFWARDPQAFADVNVGGHAERDRRSAHAPVASAWSTRAPSACSASTARAGGRASDETSYADIAHLFGSYKRTKYVAEHEVLRAAAQGAPVSIVLPTFPLGPGDRRPTPTGKLILDFLNGKMPAFVDTTMNVVHVDDLATGHLAALEQGANGRSYILGGENRSMQSILEVLAECTGLRAPRLQVPKAVALAAGVALTARRGPAAATRAERLDRSGPDVDDPHGLRRPPRPQRDRLHVAARRGRDRRLGPLVRRPRLRHAEAPRGISWIK